jgi:hypothetical protein
LSGFKSYKIRDGVHIPSKKYKEGWDAIFGNKKKSTKGLGGELENQKTGTIISGKNKVTKRV